MVHGEGIHRPDVMAEAGRVEGVGPDVGAHVQEDGVPAAGGKERRSIVVVPALRDGGCAPEHPGQEVADLGFPDPAGADHPGHVDVLGGVMRADGVFGLAMIRGSKV